MARNISFDTLLDFAEGRLSEAERAEVAVQLQNDPSAAAEVAQLRQMIARMRADTTEDAPAHVLNRAMRLLRQRRTQAERAPDLLQRILAVLTFDSTSSLAMGMRSGESQSRQLLFSAQGLDLDVRVTPAASGFIVSGQMLGPEAEGAVLLANDVVSAQALLGELGEFAFPVVPAGVYKLTLHHGNVEVVVPELKLGTSTTNR
jgi:anti-sigma factor RsiW